MREHRTPNSARANFSPVPRRAFSDRRMKARHLRALGAICVALEAPTGAALISLKACYALRWHSSAENRRRDRGPRCDLSGRCLFGPTLKSGCLQRQKLRERDRSDGSGGNQGCQGQRMIPCKNGAHAALFAKTVKPREAMIFWMMIPLSAAPMAIEVITTGEAPVPEGGEHLIHRRRWV